MADNLELHRDSVDHFKNRGLSSNIPKPNIVRIEVLDGNARRRYLGTLQRQGDQLRSNLYDELTARSDRVFFGFLRNGGNQDFGFTNKWKNQPGSGNLLGGIKKLASGIAPNLTETVVNVANVAADLTGTNATSTGSSSLKKYEELVLDDFNVECSWYLPEQYNLCITSLQILARMGYPRQAPSKVLEAELPSILESMFNDFSKANDAQTSTQTTADGNNPQVKASPTASYGSLLGQLAIKGGQTAINGMTTFNRFFGRNLTFDPLPVRVNVGQYIDIEPLVITKIKFNFSKETFVQSATGRHLPILCSVNINFEYWLKPAPEMEFTSLLGRELFGQDFSKQHKALQEAQAKQQKKKMEEEAKATQPTFKVEVTDYLANKAAPSDTLLRQEQLSQRPPSNTARAKPVSESTREIFGAVVERGT